eukprot:4936028-Pleurochrysis_carterae.AAC.1
MITHLTEAAASSFGGSGKAGGGSGDASVCFKSSISALSLAEGRQDRSRSTEKREARGTDALAAESVRAASEDGVVVAIEADDADALVGIGTGGGGGGGGDVGAGAGGGAGAGVVGDVGVGVGRGFGVRVGNGSGIIAAVSSVRVRTHAIFRCRGLSKLRPH